jgi:hypothetical protein
MNDLQFLTGPSVADMDGKPGEELLAGSAYLDLQAYNGQGKPADPAWPKLSSGWMVANPLIGSFGTMDTAPGVHKTVVSMTRDGLVFAYRTQAGACSPSSWPRFHHDLANSGSYDRDAVAPGVPLAPKFAKGRLTFRAPGDDLMCGRAARYELVESNRKLGPGSFAQGIPIPVATKPKDPGSAETVELGGKLQRFLMLRAVDDQGNVGRMVRLATGGGGHGNGDGGGKKPTCVDSDRPQSAIVSRSVKHRTKGLTVRGHTFDKGCHNRAVAKKRNAVAASVALARRAGGDCSWLEPTGSFGKPRGCGSPTFHAARLKYVYAKRRATWRFHTGVKLHRGKYLVMARAVDQSGNVETRFTRRNRKMFRVKARVEAAR